MKKITILPIVLFTFVWQFLAFSVPLRCGIILLKGDLGICTTDFCPILLIWLYQTEVEIHPIIIITEP